MTRLGLGLILGLGICVAGCGEDGGLKGEPVRLNSLKGTYELNDKGCKARVDESAITLVGCQWEEPWGEGVATHDITGGAVLSESTISYSGSWKRTEPVDEDRGCGPKKACEVNTSGSAKKNEGRQEEGPFSTFAGKWSGSLSVDSLCTFTEIPANAEGCVEDVVVNALTFDLDITGYLIKVDYDGDATGSGEAIATENFIEIEDAFTFKKL